MALICATLVRALVLSAAFAGALTPVRCLSEDGNQLPENATKELSPELLSLLRQKKMPKHSPIILRVFKDEAELEVWKQDTTGHFQIFKTYPICRWSGDLGPKLHEGDRQTPEGFYTITPELMNPNSNYYLAINIGFPNAFDKANDRDGTFLMIHGDCSSSGCYAMTDEQIGEIYALARASLSGQPSFQIQAYPFRLTPANLARHRTNPNMAFWKMLKDRERSFRGDASPAQGGGLRSPLCVRCATPVEFDKPAGVRSGRPLPSLCRQSENRSGGAGETARRRGRICAIGQRQRASRPNLQRTRRRNEQSLPGPGRREHTAGKSTGAGSVAATAGTRRNGRQWWHAADAGEQDFWRFLRLEACRSTDASRRDRVGDTGARL
jgi:murein L,D-transpeptidase YafK